MILSYVDDNSNVKSFQRSALIKTIVTSMANNPLEWNHVINITGGDMSIRKCKLSILKWKSSFSGLQQHMACTEDKSTICIKYGKDDCRIEHTEET